MEGLCPYKSRKDQIVLTIAREARLIRSGVYRHREYEYISTTRAVSAPSNMHTGPLGRLALTDSW